jgi:aryl-alcohol dehydrogenase-like predicted oxidoreductase
MSIREKAGLIAYSPMAFGMLSGKYHKKVDVPTDRINKFKTMSRYSTEQCHKATEHYIKIAEKYGITPAEMSLAWINQQEFVTATIIGATKMDQLKENIGSINIELSKDCIKEINEVQKTIPNPAP